MLKQILQLYIAVLKREILISCPLLTTTTIATTSTTIASSTTDSADECPAPCAELIHEMEDKTFELSDSIVNQDKNIANLNVETIQLVENVDDQSKRMCNLEQKSVEFSDENASQKQEVVELKSENIQQQATNSMLLQVNVMFEARIAELEEMRELISRPCSYL